MKKNYNGWANYATWNVALTINNDYSLYQTVYNYANSKKNVNFTDFLRTYKNRRFMSVDGVDFKDKRVIKREISLLIKDLQEAKDNEKI